LILNVGTSATMEHLPIGTVRIEVSRRGQRLETTRVELTAAQNAATVLLKAPFDLSGQWDEDAVGCAREEAPWCLSFRPGR